MKCFGSCLGAASPPKGVKIHRDGCRATPQQPMAAALKPGREVSFCKSCPSGVASMLYLVATGGAPGLRKLRVRCLKRSSERMLHHFRPLSLLFVATVAWPLSCLAQQAHVHGHAHLGVAVDGPTLLVDLSAPLEALVGFEHEPRTARQREAMVVMKARLNQAEVLWRPNAEAACVAQSHEVDVHHGQGHADVSAHVSFQCAKPEALRHLDVDMWQAFAHLKVLSVSVALPRVQFTRRIQRSEGGQARPSRLALVPKKAK